MPLPSDIEPLPSEPADPPEAIDPALPPVAPAPPVPAAPPVPPVAPVAPALPAMGCGCGRMGPSSAQLAARRVRGSTDSATDACFHDRDSLMASFPARSPDGSREVDARSIHG